MKRRISPKTTPKRVGFVNVAILGFGPEFGRCNAFTMANSKASPKKEPPVLAIAAPLTNRRPDGSFDFPADNWYLIAPFGDHPYHGKDDKGKAFTVTQRIDKAATDAMSNAMKPGDELLVDFEHESHNPDKRTSASGWVQALRTGMNGLEAQIRWTGPGKTSLSNGEYRFISPVWLAQDCEMVDDDTIRPLRLNDAGLTNTPNLKGLRPLSNREALRAAIQPNADDESAITNKEREKMEKLLKALGLAADASEDSAIEAVTTLQNRASDLEKDKTALTNSNRSLLEATVEADLNGAGITDDAERTTWKNELLKNRESALPLLASLVKNRGNAQADTLTNRGKSKTPVTNKGGQGGSDKSRQQQIDEAVASAPGKTFTEKFENAKRANAELFKMEEESA